MSTKSEAKARIARANALRESFKQSPIMHPRCLTDRQLLAALRSAAMREGHEDNDADTAAADVYETEILRRIRVKLGECRVESETRDHHDEAIDADDAESQARIDALLATIEPD